MSSSPKGWSMWITERLTSSSRLSLSDMALSGLSLILVVVTSLVVRGLPFARWYPPFERFVHRPRRLRRRSFSCRESVRIARAVARVARRFPSYRCLSCAVAGAVLYRVCGYAPQFRIGVRIDARSGLMAHAWVVVDGRTCVGDLPDLAGYRSLRLSGVMSPGWRT